MGLFLQKLHEEKVGVPDLIELVKGSGDVNTDSLLPQKVIPYWTLLHV